MIERDQARERDAKGNAGRARHRKRLAGIALVVHRSLAISKGERSAGVASTSCDNNLIHVPSSLCLRRLRARRNPIRRAHRALSTHSIGSTRASGRKLRITQDISNVFDACER